MGISRDSRHKRRATGGRRVSIRKKRKYELGRPAAMTRIGALRVHTVRTRGGNQKHRALRLDHGNFSWGTESLTRKTRIVNVIYNASNNELVRTNTLVKGAIVQIDATPFRAYYEKKYGVHLGKKKEGEEKGADVSKRVARKQKANLKAQPSAHVQLFLKQFDQGRLTARLTSRPGQSGRADGVILEGEELVFVQKKTQKKKKGQA